MSESRYLKMKVFSTILTVCFCLKFSVQIDIEPNSSNNGQYVINQTTITQNYSVDQQIDGFNGTNLTSGPIVIVDKRTLFIADLRFHNVDGTLEFWAGPGKPFGDEKHLVLKESLESPMNLYVILPANLTMDAINFLQVTSKNSSLDYVIFEKVDKNLIRTYDPQNVEDTVFRIPKCCAMNEYLNDTLKDCAEALRPVAALDINIFESNETGLDPDIKLNSSQYHLVPYYRNLICGENGNKLMVEGIYGLIYNSSLIIQGTGILSHREYCIDTLAMEDGNSENAALYCYYQTAGTSDPGFYIPVLTISTLCFASSAVAYFVILKAKPVYNISFIIYSSSMGVAFLILILMHFHKNKIFCNLFGFVFLFTTVLAFFWLLIFCIELLYLVMCPIEKDRYKYRWYWYGSIVSGLSFLTLLVSLFSGDLWVPDVPSSFIISMTNSCEFDTTFDRTFIIFVPMAVSIVGSIASLSVLTTCINRHTDPKIINHYEWLDNVNDYKFLSRTSFIVIVIATFWPATALLTEQWGSGKTQLAFDVIKASLGIVTLIGFVLNKYTVQKLKHKLFKRPVVNETELELNGIPTPEETSLITRENNSTGNRNISR